MEQLVFVFTLSFELFTLIGPFWSKSHVTVSIFRHNTFKRIMIMIAILLVWWFLLTCYYMMVLTVVDMVWCSGRNGQGGGFPGITGGGGTVTRGYSKGGPGGGSSDSDDGIFTMIFGSNSSAAAVALRPRQVWSIVFTIILLWYFPHHRRWQVHYWFKGFHYLF